MLGCEIYGYDRNKIKNGGSLTRKRKRLIQEATATAELRGHKLGEWIGNGLSFAMANCQDCGCQATVEAEPKPNGIKVGGRALAVDCKGEQELIRYGIVAYGFLLGPGTWTYGELAEKIKRHYSLNEPHNWAVYDALRYHDHTQQFTISR